MGLALSVVTCITSAAHKKLYTKNKKTKKQKDKKTKRKVVALLSMTEHMLSWPRKLPMKAALC